MEQLTAMNSVEALVGCGKERSLTAKSCIPPVCRLVSPVCTHPERSVPSTGVWSVSRLTDYKPVYVKHVFLVPDAEMYFLTQTNKILIFLSPIRSHISTFNVEICKLRSLFRVYLESFTDYKADPTF